MTNIYCKNCGNYEHNYKHCQDPITSYGIILIKENEDKTISFLVVQRKFTYEFVEFIKGRYKMDNIDYIYNLLKYLTVEEIDKILTFDFVNLWIELCYNNNKINKIKKIKYDKECAIAKVKFDYIIAHNKEYILNLKNNNNNELEYGFPKGRLNIDENLFDCACREFTEETNINIEDITFLFDLKTFSETFMGSNNIYYKHIYYLAKINKEIILEIKTNSQIDEINNIKFFTKNELEQLIKDDLQDRKNIINEIQSYFN